MMVVVRCTQKLLRRLPAPSFIEANSSTALGDWCGNLIGIGHLRIALFISERSRLPVLLPGRDMANLDRRLAEAVGQILRALGVRADRIRLELEAMADVHIAHTNSRSLLGSLNDFADALRWRLGQEPSADLLSVALKLAETPVGPLGYRAPDEVTRKLLG
jgi:hypothetical protein